MVFGVFAGESLRRRFTTDHNRSFAQSCLQFHIDESPWPIQLELHPKQINSIYGHNDLTVGWRPWGWCLLTRVSTRVEWRSAIAHWWDPDFWCILDPWSLPPPALPILPSGRPHQQLHHEESAVWSCKLHKYLQWYDSLSAHSFVHSLKIYETHTSRQAQQFPHWMWSSLSQTEWVEEDWQESWLWLRWLEFGSGITETQNYA